ncbi:sodium/potassium/calcium exchanger 4-like [Mya arenaria]|uniref:sodium/potassium/calcium exchanger 4-like n=1 Tax=Mya arenaria TaxID=6604 RepID=UPI0022DFD781|nr:sodium/potassium/calcium exchanger 4-like [Mya arenaria]XP_052768644.1 sodium/potassium/calcium exchanger 4-like [Mya arenaria]
MIENHTATVLMPLENVTSYFNATTSQATEVCTHPAFHEFPPDAFTTDQRAHGAIIFHLVLVVYMFIALALVCDDYFVSSLDKICEKLGFSEDVAGATFMAAGSSMPELFTAIIGVFITKGDVGIGTIVGSAVFNILFVIGLCGLLVKQAMSISWWPLCRDSACYSISVVVLILVVKDGEVTWWESVIMLLLYALYILIMRFNRTLQSVATEKLKWLTSEKLTSNGFVRQQLNKFQGEYEQFGDDDDVFGSTVEHTELNEVNSASPVTPDIYASTTKFRFTFEEAAFRLLMSRRCRGRRRFRAAAWLIILYRQRMRSDQAFMRRQMFRQTNRASTMRSCARSVRNWISMASEVDNYDGWRAVPSLDHDGYLACIRWAIVYPLRTLLYFTIPDCRKHRWEKYYLATFFISITWIAVFSYVTVWMVTYIGFAFGIPDSVMGITFLAAGTSIPDAMASIFVAKQGMADMAVSNCVGSNIFDILIGLSFPWFIQTALVTPGSVSQINSSGMVFNIILLFLTVIITIGAIHVSGWVLNKCVGVTCITVYSIYITFAIMIECNVFGFVNPPMCKE